MSLDADGERPTGFLRNADREYLAAPETYGSSRQVRSNRRRDIKQRVASAISDLARLASLEEELRDELLEGAAEKLDEYGETGVGEFGDALSLLYELVEDHDAPATAYDDSTVRFERVLSNAVTKYTRRHLDPENEFVLGTPNVEIEEPYQFDPEETLQTAEEGRLDELDENQLKFALYMERDDFRKKMDSLVEDGLSRARAYRRTLSKFETQTRVYSATVSEDFTE